MSSTSSRALPQHLTRRYQVLGFLGAGGMGAVYKTFDRLLGRPIALKMVLAPTLNSQDQNDRKVALATEFQTLASLRHPNIITVLDYGFDEVGQAYFTMELLDQPQTILQAGANLTPQGRVSLLVQALQALSYLHRRGIVHRDLKPSNILVNRGVVKLVDFGLASDQGAVHNVAGTVAYMPPEAFRGGQITRRSDLYSLGMVAYELLTGSYPFDTRQTNLLIQNVLNVTPDLSPLTAIERVFKPIVADGQSETLTRLDIPDLSQTSGLITNVIDGSTFQQMGDDQLATVADIVADITANTDTAEVPVVAPVGSADGSLAGVVAALLSKHPSQRPESAEKVIHLLCASLRMALPEQSEAIRESFLQSARLIGREREQKTLLAALDSTSKGQGAVWLVGGEAGVGKSRLLDTLRTQALVRGFLVLRGQAASESGLPFGTWREVLRRLVVEVDLNDLDAAILRDLVPDIPILLERDIPPAPPLEPRLAQERLISAALGLIRAYDKPLVILLEDLHWATESVDLLRRIMPLTKDRTLLIVGSFRSDERPKLPELLVGAQTLALPRLTEGETAQLAESMLGEVATQPALIRYLQRETEGNAFFLVEVARALAESARGLHAINSASLPTSLSVGGIQALLRRRMERLPQSAHSLLQIAAVLGRQVDLAVLQAIDSAMPLEPWLAACADAAILEIYEGQWRFRHDKLRESVLSEMDPEIRKILHRVSAAALEARYARSREHAAIISYHWRQAGDSAKERTYALLGIEHLVLVGANQDAISLAERALALLPAENKLQRAAVLLQMALAYEFLGDYPKVIALCEELLPLCQAEKPSPRLIAGMRLLSIAKMRLGKPDEALQQAVLGLATAESFEDRLGEASLRALISGIHSYLDQYQQAVVEGEKALALAIAANDLGLQARTISVLGGAYYGLGNTEKALQTWETALELSRRVGDRNTQVSISGNLGTLCSDLALLEKARDYQEQAYTLAHQTGSRRAECYSLINLGTTAHVLGQTENAVRYNERGLALARDMGDKYAECIALQNVGSTAHALGNTVKAINALMESADVARAIQQPHTLATSQVALAWVYLGTHMLVEAADSARAALESGAKLATHEAAAVLGYVYALRSEESQAKASFQQALDLSQALLTDNPRWFRAQYTKVLALSGLVAITGYDLPAAQEAIRQARAACNAEGVLNEVSRVVAMLMPIAPLSTGSLLQLLEENR